MGRYSFIIAGGILVALLLSCEEEQFTTSRDARLAFSLDTVLFDTVFTTIGSTTRHFRVYNRHRKSILISSIFLAGGDESDFRLNINGLQSNYARDIELRAKDSLYIFVEVTVDPVGQNTPMVIQDSVVFITNGNVQDVDLVAWGQDVHLINGEIVKSTVWNNEKPYLVYNSMLVDTLETLTIEAGTRIHFHNGSTMYISGTLVVNGTMEEPVIFQGDRLEEMYRDIPGQWGGLYFINGSSGNAITYAEIKNAINGIHLGNLYSASPPPDLQLSNTLIQHMNYGGISSIGATVSASNCVVSDCGFYGLILTTGGSYEFYHCTVGNYWSYANRVTPALLLTNYYNLYDTALFTGELLKADFGNCIIYGDKATEIGIQQLEGYGAFNYLFYHCLIKADTTKIDVTDPGKFRTVYLNRDPKFASIADSDYQLDTLSFAKDKGAAEIGLQYPFDLLQQSRTNDAGPDLGAYERIEQAPKRH